MKNSRVSYLVTFPKYLAIQMFFIIHPYYLFLRLVAPSPKKFTNLKMVFTSWPLLRAMVFIHLGFTFQLLYKNKRQLSVANDRKSHFFGIFGMLFF